MTLSGASAYSSVVYSTVRGGVTMNDNTRAYAVGNSIETDLACAGNGLVSNEDPVTLIGMPNTVGGVTLGQCAGL